MSKSNMKLKEALEIVLCLAENNSLDPQEMEGEGERLVQEAKRQRKAIEIVTKHIDTLLD